METCRHPEGSEGGFADIVPDRGAGAPEAGLADSGQLHPRHHLQAH